MDHLCLISLIKVTLSTGTVGDDDAAVNNDGTVYFLPKYRTAGEALVIVDVPGLEELSYQPGRETRESVDALWDAVAYIDDTVVRPLIANYQGHEVSLEKDGQALKLCAGSVSSLFPTAYEAWQFCVEAQTLLTGSTSNGAWSPHLLEQPAACIDASLVGQRGLKVGMSTRASSGASPRGGQVILSSEAHGLLMEQCPSEDAVLMFMEEIPCPASSSEDNERAPRKFYCIRPECAIPDNPPLGRERHNG